MKKRSHRYDLTRPRLSVMILICIKECLMPNALNVYLTIFQLEHEES